MPINPTVTAEVTGLILQVGVQFRIKGGPSMNENYILIGVFFVVRLCWVFNSQLLCVPGTYKFLLTSCIGVSFYKLQTENHDLLGCCHVVQCAVTLTKLLINCCSDTIDEKLQFIFSIPSKQHSFILVSMVNFRVTRASSKLESARTRSLIVCVMWTRRTRSPS